jgi:WD40 repeat protein
VGAPADVYAIGAMLYHMLTHQLPHAGETQREVLVSILANEQVPIREIEPAIPEELATIVSKAMAHDPERRYPTARELAEDLKRFHTGQLVGAHRYTRWQLTQRWLRQHRILWAVAASVILVGATGYVRVVHERNEARRQRDLAEVAQAASVVERQRAERSGAEMQRRGNALILAQAENLLDADPTLSLAWLKSYPADGEEWPRVQALAVEAEGRGVAHRVLGPVDGALMTLSASPDGKRAIAYSGEGVLRLWDLDRATATTLDGKLALSVGAVAFTPDGSRIVAGSDAGALMVYDAATGAARRVPGHDGIVYDLAFSPDGRRAVTAGGDGALRVWDRDFRTSLVLRGHRAAVGRARFAGDHAIVSCGLDGRLLRWELDGAGPGTASAPRSLGVCDLAKEVGVSLSVAADGRSVAVPRDGRRVDLIDLASGRSRTLATMHGDVSHVELSPDGALAAIAAFDGEVRVIGRDGALRRTLRHDGPAYLARFSSDGRYLATAGESGTILVYDTVADTVSALRGHGAAIWTMRFLEGQPVLLSGGHHGDLRVWRLDRPSSQIAVQHDERALDLAYAASGARGASASRDGTLRIWPATLSGSADSAVAHFGQTFPVQVGFAGETAVARLTSGDLVFWDGTGAPTRVHGAAVTALATIASLDGGPAVVTGDASGAVSIWDPGATAPRRTIATGASVTYIAADRSGARIAVGHGDGAISIVTLATGTVVRHQGLLSAITGAAFAPDGRALVTAGIDGRILYWPLSGNADGVTPREVARHRTAARAVAFSAAGDCFAATGGDGWVEMIDARTLRVVASDQRTGGTSALAFTAEGEVASVGEDGSLRLLRRDGSVALERDHEGYAYTLAVQPGTDRLGTVGLDGAVRTRGLGSLRRAAVPAGAARLGAWLARQTNLAVGPPTDPQPANEPPGASPWTRRSPD